MNSNSPNPRLSIIVATWNASLTLETLLLSVLCQRFSEWEILIADGGSTDGTVDIIRKYESRIAWWKSAEDEGIYDAWNLAITHATGDYVCFIGADDRLPDTNVLSAMADAINNESPDIVSGRAQLVDRHGAVVSTFGEGWNYKKLRRRITICHPGAWFRRNLFAKIGAFDLRYRIVADYQWLLRLPESTSSCFVDRVVMEVGDGGVSRTQLLNRLRERREAQASCPRIGKLLAYVYWVDKLWRWPIARTLGLNY